MLKVLDAFQSIVLDVFYPLLYTRYVCHSPTKIYRVITNGTCRGGLPEHNPAPNLTWIKIYKSIPTLDPKT